MAHKYIEAEDAINLFMPDVDANDADTVLKIESIIEQVSAYIDGHCDRPLAYFMPAGDTATERRFRGRGTTYIQLPVHVAESVSIEGVADAVWYEGTNGWIYYNDINAGNGDDYFTEGRRFWETGRQYAISAKWGYAETPKPIVAAAGEITAAIWSKGKGIVGDISPTGFVIEREIPLTSRGMLRPFVKREFEVS